MARELAILVTARNMASGVLRDVRGDIRGIQGEARRAAVNTGRNLAMAGAAAAGFVAVQVKAGIDSLAELERMQAQTAAVIESTGGAAGITAERVRDLAEEYENLTTVDDKAIQNAENLLLTFTSVTEDAFEPALQAILDMNAAMGGDEESLEQRAIQVGKALNDPIRGATALRRVGVQLTEQQEDEIKTLIEQNDLYGAQQIILEELAKEFGGSAAAQADTFQGKMRRVQDAVEDAQMALATAFLPVLEKVADKLQTFLSDPATLKGIEEFGGTLAEGLEGVIEIIENIPWDAVGATFSLMGEGAKVVLDMFTSLPDWVQTAVLTGWGLNKLTGGALGNIVGQLASSAFGGARGATPANPVFVSDVTGGVGGGAGRGGRGGGRGFPLLGVAGAAGIALSLSGSDNPEADPIASQQMQLQTLHDAGLLTDARFSELWARAFAGANISAELDAIQRGTGDTAGAVDRATDHLRTSVTVARDQRTAINNLNMSEAARAASAASLLSQIRDRRANIALTVNTSITVSAAAVNKQLTSYRESLGQGGFI